MPDLVAVEGPQGPAWVSAVRRCWDAGDSILPVDHRLSHQAVNTLFASLRPTRVLTVGESPHDREVRRLPDGRPSEPGDAVVLATSGTTGDPKGVVLTHAAIEAAAHRTTRRLGGDAQHDHWLCCLPLAHAGGLGVVTRAIITGTPLTVQPGFDAEAVLAETARRRADGRRVLTSLVATALRRIDPSMFGIVLLGGDAPPRWPDGKPSAVVVTYGMTETGGGCVYDGRPLDDVEVEIDPSGQIRLRTPMLGRAYRTAMSDEALAGSDGWFDTGDGGMWAADGTLAVAGRLNDVIVTGGEKVWPAAVEAALTTCPGVQAAAVIGRPDAEWGQRVVAVIVPSDPDAPPTLAELRRAVGDQLSPWAAPKQLELVEALPTTSLGKLRRAGLA